MPLPATHLQSVQTAVKMANAPELSLRGGRRPTWQSRSTLLDNRAAPANSQAAAIPLERASFFYEKNSRCTAQRLPFYSVLLRAEDTIARITEAGHDISMLVQMVIDSSDIEVDIGMRLRHGLHALGRSDDIH